MANLRQRRGVRPGRRGLLFRGELQQIPSKEERRFAALLIRRSPSLEFVRLLACCIFGKMWALAAINRPLSWARFRERICGVGAARRSIARRKKYTGYQRINGSHGTKGMRDPFMP
jgi:hypothetical protein